MQSHAARTLRMMRMLVLVAALALAPVAQGQAAILYLSNAEDGSASMNLAPGESGELSFFLEIDPVDTGFAFAFVFLDDDDNEADGPIDVIGFGSPLDPANYDHDFSLPADLSQNLASEYHLIMGRIDGENWGAGTWLLETATLVHTGSETTGSIPVTFEPGPRAPGIFTADFAQYVWNEGLAGILPDHVDPGVGADGNPFKIDMVPEPGTLIVAAAGLTMLFRRRRTR